jgi:hypothetical protein
MALRYYGNVLGLILAEQAPDGRAYLKAWDEQDHHQLYFARPPRPVPFT